MKEKLLKQKQLREELQKLNEELSQNRDSAKLEIEMILASQDMKITSKINRENYLKLLRNLIDVFSNPDVKEIDAELEWNLIYELREE